MKLVRSWPHNIPEGRAYVVDDIPKFIMGGPGATQYDYRGLADLNDDVVLIEWDIAVGGLELARFMERAKAEPDRVRVAPYHLYRGGRNGRSPLLPFYCHRVRAPGTKTWVKGPTDTHCNMFGFGLVYLPRDLIRRFVAQLPAASKFGDTEFSRWHMRNAKHRDVPIDWDVPLVHLHYRIPEVP